ncbi:MAG: hypothetical protein ACRENB_11015 [Gemmatimonadales bacterium]
MRTTDELIDRAFEAERALPDVLRTTYQGAVFILGLARGRTGRIFVGSVLLVVILLTGVTQGVGRFLTLIVVLVTAGTVGGFVYGCLVLLERVPLVGPWIRWATGIFAYLATLAVAGALHPFELLDPFFLGAAGVLSALGALGMVLADDRAPTRPSARRFRLLLARERMRAGPHRMWLQMRTRLERQEAWASGSIPERRVNGRREPRERLRETMAADLEHARRVLARSEDAAGDLQEVEAWMERVRLPRLLPSGDGRRGPRLEPVVEPLAQPPQPIHQQPGLTGA